MTDAPKSTAMVEADQYAAGFFEGLRPDPRLTVSLRSQGNGVPAGSLICAI